MSEKKSGAGGAGAPVIQLVPLENLVARVWPENPRRRIDTAAAEFIELVASIKTNGVKIPGFGRPHPTLEGKTDLCAGARRLAAARIAGVETMPVIVEDMDDLTAAKITFLENSGRENLSVLEEAQGVCNLLALGATLKTIAKEMDLSIGTVARRAQLSKLSPEWVARFDELAQDGDVGVAQMELIASMPEATQAYLFKQLGGNAWAMQASRFDAFKSSVSQYCRLLVAAPWDLKDAKLFKTATACAACPKRSSCQPLLFEGQFVDETGENLDACLDAECWQGKLDAHIDQQERKLAKKTGAAVLKVSSRYGQPTEGLLRSHEYDLAEKGDAGAVSALMMDGEDAGAVVSIIPRKSRNEADDDVELSPEEQQLEIYRQAVSNVAVGLGQRINSMDYPAKLMTADKMLGLIAWLGVDSVLDVVELGTFNEAFAQINDAKQKELLTWLWVRVRESIVVNALRKDWDESHADFTERIKIVAKLMADADALQQLNELPEAPAEDESEDDEQG